MSIWIQCILFYLLAANVVGFYAAYSDKRKARLHKWRTPEKAFSLIALAGGGAGVLLGFVVFRHKTKHVALVFAVALCTAVSYAAIYMIFMRFQRPI